MKRLIFILFTCSTLFFYHAAFASEKCEAEPVHGVTIKATGEIRFDQSGVTRSAGNISTPVGSRTFDALLLAVDKKLLVQTAYPDGYNCKVDGHTAPEWIYIQNPTT